MAGNAVEINDATFDTEVLQSTIPVLVDFWAPWCGPCMAIAPAVEALATEFAGKVKVCKINIDSARQSAVTYRVNSIPALMLFSGGKVVDQIMGAQPKERIAMMLLKHAG